MFTGILIGLGYLSLSAAWVYTSKRLEWGGSDDESIPILGAIFPFMFWPIALIVCGLMPLYHLAEKQAEETRRKQMLQEAEECRLRYEQQRLLREAGLDSEED